MKVALMVPFVTDETVDLVLHAEKLGVDSVWVPEMWAYDAFTPLAYLAARTSRIKLATGVVQLGARTPASLASSAMSLQALSGGRFLLGMGVSGPKVMEGWHGVRFDAPVTMTRETIEIIRLISAGEKLSYQGKVFQLPLPDSQGRALTSFAPPAHVPIYNAALGPRNLRLTGELADGWLGNAFLPESADVFLDPIAAGAAESGRTLADLDLVAPVAVEITDDVDAVARKHAGGYAFTIGAMGEFYRKAFERQGFELDEVVRLWKAGEREAAADAVPVDIGAKTNLLGTEAMIAERITLLESVGISTLLVKLDGGIGRQIDTLARLLGILSHLNV
ncbi:LLM class flavin-dependent oxidoreductase [Pseudonocardiaceae bacterium YIM PH 21723]|nr:LLM class flavin-dependent oxidoreductase [Pseudonocardiaceae bacterium YIM PH 21723]